MAVEQASSFYGETLVLLGAAVIAAPLFKQLGLGTVLGYLAAGIIIGPTLRMVSDGEDILHFAELGVVFLLFVIGLELKPQRLWSMRQQIFGLGLSQVVVSGVLLAALAFLIGGTSLQAALVTGFGLALSSTAFALQVLEERSDISTPYVRTSFAILLFQDLAIVPMLAILPLLAPVGGDVEPVTLWDLALAVGAVAALIVAGRYVLDPVFRFVGNTGAREAMIATALLIVLGSAMLMQIVGLSMAMGAFIAGVMLAESAYRHELEADIEPFRGLLLGLFFMAIGLSLDLSVIAANWPIILICVPIVMASKSVVIYGLCRLFGQGHDTGVRTALVLPQGGEFGFVLFSAAATLGIFSTQTASILVAIVTLSMALTPLSVMANRLLLRADTPEAMDEDFVDMDERIDVLMIGFSRFGQVASQILLAGGSNVTIIDHSAERVRSAQSFGFRIYFGDGTRKDVLDAAGVGRARLIAVCTQKRDITDRIVELIQRDYPEARLFVRSYDRTHTLELRAREVDYELRETFESGLAFGTEALTALGTSNELADQIRQEVRKRDTERLRIQAVDGIYAGRHMLHTKPVSPEPLSKPRHEARVVNMDTQETEPEKATEPVL